MIGLSALLPLIAAHAQGGGTFTLMNRPMLPFKFKSVEGTTITPKSLLGKPSVVFVFCSCIECKRVAEDWASLQKTGAKQPATALTVVYLGNRKEVTAFAARMNLKGAKYIADPEAAFAKTYRAMPCPTVFVADRKGIVRYASKEVAGELVSDSDILVGQTLATLKQLVAHPESMVAIQPKVAVIGPQLSPVMDPELALSGKADLTWTVKLDAGETSVHRSFTFFNRTPAPIDIESLLTSCGCQKATMTYQGKETKSAVVKPGKGLLVELEVAVPEGISSKTVSAWLYTRAVTPAASIRIVITRH